MCVGCVCLFVCVRVRLLTRSLARLLDVGVVVVDAVLVVVEQVAALQVLLDRVLFVVDLFCKISVDTAQESLAIYSY